MEDMAVLLTKELIHINSYNPPGNEKLCAAYLQGILRDEGFRTEIIDFGDNRCNLVAEIGSGDEGILLAGHLDVVPVNEKWKFDPLGADEKDGRIYGRGSCDMKGGVAAMTAAAITCARENMNRKRITLVFTGDEEVRNRGMKSLLKVRQFKAAAAIMGEPTELEIHLGNRGYASFTVSTEGKSCHAGNPDNGINAIYKMTDIIGRLRELSVKVTKITHPLMGKASLNVGTVHGGTKINIVPDQCYCEVERRVLPGESEAKITAEIAEAAGLEANVKLESYFDACDISPGHSFVKALSEIVSDVTGEACRHSVFPAGTEAGFLTACGIPTVILGPGSISNAHKEDEFVPISDIINSFHIYKKVIDRYTRSN